MPYLCCSSVLFSSPRTPSLIHFSFAELLEFLKYKNNGLVAQRSSLCWTSRARGQPLLTFTFDFTSQIASPFKCYIILWLKSKILLFYCLYHPNLWCLLSPFCSPTSDGLPPLPGLFRLRAMLCRSQCLGTSPRFLTLHRWMVSTLSPEDSWGFWTGQAWDDYIIYGQYVGW